MQLSEALTRPRIYRHDGVQTAPGAGGAGLFDVVLHPETRDHRTETPAGPGK